MPGCHGNNSLPGAPDTVTRGLCPKLAFFYHSASSFAFSPVFTWTSLFLCSYKNQTVPPPTSSKSGGNARLSLALLSLPTGGTTRHRVAVGTLRTPVPPGQEHRSLSLRLRQPPKSTSSKHRSHTKRHLHILYSSVKARLTLGPEEVVSELQCGAFHHPSSRTKGTEHPSRLRLCERAAGFRLFPKRT